MAVTTEQLQAVLRGFLEEGNRAVSRSDCDAVGRRKEAWDAAHAIASAVVLGLQKHIPEVLASAVLVKGRDCMEHCQALSSGGNGIVAAVIVRITVDEAIGEFATRSRIGSMMRLSKEVCFALRDPPKDVTTDPLVLEVSGLDFPALAEIGVIRKRLRALLGEGFNKSNVFKWWLQNRDLEYPLDKSKMRRMHASSFEGLPMVRPPDFAAEKALWGYINAPSNVFECFQFYDEGKNDIRITGIVLPANDPEEIRTRELCDDVASEVMRTQRALAEPWLPSAINISALTHGRSSGGPGAEPHKIAKLFTAADLWGPGKKGYQEVDNTWICTDIKDSMGRTVKQQGRVIWISPGETAIPRTPGERKRSKILSVPKDVTPMVFDPTPKKSGLSSSIPWLTVAIVLVALIARQFSRSAFLCPAADMAHATAQG